MPAQGTGGSTEGTVPPMVLPTVVLPRRCIVASMTQVVLVTDTWWKVVDVDAADEVIEAEGMSWERDGTHAGNLVAGDRPTDVPSQVPRYVPSVGA